VGEADISWLSQPFDRFSSQLEAISSSLRTTKSAVESLRLTARLVQLLARFDPPVEVTQAEIAAFERLADDAKPLLESDFALAHSLSTLATWSALEALVHELVAGVIWALPRKLAEKHRDKLKVPVLIALSGDDERVGWTAMDELRRNLASGLKAGIGQFESLLDAVGLGGAVPDALRREMVEFCEVRNVLAHKSGIVDRRAKDACPYLPEEAGARILVGSTRFDGYFRNARDYSVLIADRLPAFVGS